MQELTRGARNLASTVSAMQSNFAAAHAAMAKKTSEEREAFVADMIREVSSLLEDFSRIRGDMTRTGRNDREAFLSEMKRQVRGLRKETADDLTGARLAWRGRSPRKPRPVPMKKEPVVVKPIPPPMEAALKKTVAAPEIKTEKPPVKFTEPLKKEPVVVKPIPPPATFKEPLKKEVEKKTVAAPEAPAVETPKVKAPPLVSVSKPPFQKSKEKSWLDEKPAKARTRAKRGRK
ncbi:MAG: hypothetical protein CVU53_06540 [Deltaproteobacteria bacterium HGW-Deltaproteobacteria-11]|nr:MAG: hypothetical protein CVU53_06540 [Deltaproteobacteria bacterium HGW-Deltaproteobacteria-11]